MAILLTRERRWPPRPSYARAGIGRLADIGRCANRNTWGVIQTPSPTLPTGGREIHETPSPTLPARGKDLEPILSLLRDPSLTEIMINGPDAIYVERDGRILITDPEFPSQNHT